MNKKGQSLVEVIVALAIFSLVALATSVLFLDSITSLRVGNELNEASALAYEGLDAARSIRDNKWLALDNGTHGLTTGAGYWQFSGASDTVGDYTRAITVADVDRDSSFDVIASGTKDPRTKLVTVVVTWNSRASLRSTTTSAYLTDWNVFDWLETTDGEFGFGTHSDTEVDGSGTGASVQLATGSGSGGGDLDRWLPGGGSDFQDDTDIDFGNGTVTDTLISGTGTATFMELAKETKWDVFDFPFGTLDMRGVSENYAVGKTGRIFQWSGSQWNEMVSPVTQDLRSVSDVSSTESYAVGKNGTLLRVNGSSWISLVSPTTEELKGISMISSSFGVAVGKNGAIVHWNGSGWLSVTSPTGEDLQGVFMVSATDGWAVGDNGEIIQWNGTTWSTVTSPTGEDLESVSVVDTSNAWAVGKNGEIIQWNGTTWSTTTSPTGEDLQGVSMVSATDGWIVGDNGTILQWNGVAWTSISSPSTVDLEDVYMISASSGWATGKDGVILRWSGTVWEIYTQSSTVDLKGIDLHSPSFGFTVAKGGVVEQWDGDIWSSVDSSTSEDLESVSIVDTSNAWAVGKNGEIIQWNGTIWSTITSPTGEDLKGISMVNATDGWAVGKNGVIIQWNGSTWSTVTSPTGEDLEDIFSVDTSNAWAVGKNGEIIQWNGTTWSTVTSPTGEDLKGISMVSTTDGWAVGKNGEIIQWNGTIWSIVASPTGTEIKAVSALSASDAWAVGKSGIILHWEGVSWASFSSPTGNDMEDIDVLSTTDAWAVGKSGTYLDLGEFYLASGTFESQIFNSTSASTVWDIISWTETNYSPTDVTVATRTGNTAIPDGTWSGWSSELSNDAESTITSPSGQYLQYRLSFSTTNVTVSARVDTVTIQYNDPNISDDLNAISMISTTDGWAVADGGTIAQYDGAAWSTIISPVASNLFGIDMLSASDGWAVGLSGTVLQYNGVSWSTVTSPTVNALNDIDFAASNDGWAVGESGEIISWDGLAWTLATSPTITALNGIDVVTASDVWAVGDSGVIVHYDGISWSTVTSPSVENLFEVNMVTASDGWAVGANGDILHYDGVSWTVFATGIGGTQTLLDIFMLSATDGWAVGTGGTVVHYDGSAWLLFNSPTSVNLNAVHMLASDDGWIVGDAGLFLHSAITGTTTTATFTDDGQVEFDSGSYGDTQFTIDRVELDSTGLLNGLGTFTSQIFDSNDSAASWTEFTWIPSAPYGKELPNASSIETAYSEANADMTSNVLLMHMNESSGTIVDSSGQGNDGTESGGITYGSTGLLNKAISFDGINDMITVPDSASLDITDDITLEVWTDWVSGSGSVGGTSIGEIDDVLIGNYEYQTSQGKTPSFIHISGDVYAVAYTGPGNDGFISTMNIDSSGTITTSVIDTLEFDTSNGKTPDILNVSGDIYAVAYEGPGSDGFIKTVDIDSAGNIANSVIDTLEFDTSKGKAPDILNVSGDIYAVAYEGPGSDGFTKTVDIDSAGNIANSVIDTLEFDTSKGKTPDMLNVSGDIYAVAYQGPGSDGFVKTIDIDSAGNIAGSVISSYEFDAVKGKTPNLILISGDIFAIVYAGNGDDGFLVTVDINSTGIITASLIDSLEFDTSLGKTPFIFPIASDVYGISYVGTGNNGVVYTIDIDSAGNIGSNIDIFLAQGQAPVTLYVSGNVYAIAFQGAGNDGFIATIGIETSGGGGVTTGLGISKSGAYELLVEGSTAYAVINGTTVSAVSLDSGFNHVAMTYDKDAGSNEIKLYVNGIQVATGTLTDTIVSNSNDLLIGENMEGSFDELAIYSKVLTAGEILDHYKRAALDLQFQVRSCNDAVCSGESFIGPDGTGLDYYDELDNATISLPDLSLTNVTDNQYFQYNVTFSSSDTSYSPKLESVTATYQTVTAAGGSSGFPSTGIFLSQIFNSDSTLSSWETLYWTEILPASTNATIAVRSGNTASPDVSWSSWSGEFTDPNGEDISNQGGQYVQYRISLSSSDSAVTPKVEDVTITYK